MKHIVKVMILCLIVLAWTWGAAADILPVEINKTYSTPQTYLLRKGDTVHCLSISYDPEYQRDGTCMIHVDASCSVLSGDTMQPCQSKCADFFQSKQLKDADIPRYWTMHGLTVSP